MSLGDFLSGVGEVIQTGIQTLPAIIAAGRQPGLGFGPPQIGPGVTTGVPTTLEEFASGIVGPGIGGLPAGGISAGQCAGFVPTRTTMRAIRELRAVNPSTGQINSWTHRGSPLIWSGDRALAKRYAKAAGFTLRRRGGSSHRAAARRRAPRRSS